MSTQSGEANEVEEAVTPVSFMRYYHVHLRVSDCVSPPSESDDVYHCSLAYMGSGLAEGNGDVIRFTDRIRGVIDVEDVLMLPEATKIRNDLEPGVLEYSIEGKSPLFLKGEVRAKYRLRRDRLLALHLPYHTEEATFVIDIRDPFVRPQSADFSVTDEAGLPLPDVEKRPVLQTPERDVWFVSASNVSSRSNLVLRWNVDEEKRSGTNEAFFCYAHADGREYLETFRRQLEPHLDGNMGFWADTRIRPGELWREEIEAALRRAKLAVILVSEAFNNSEFIRDSELPTLLERAKDGGLLIYWVKANACIVSERIKKFQSAWDGRPLENLSEADRRAAISSISEEILEALRHGR